MAIEITGPPSAPNPPGTGEGTEVKVGRSETSVSQQEAGKPSTTDTVTLTETAAQLNRLANTLSNLPVVDTQRVEGIKRAIANGTYELDANRLAEKMVGFEQNLFAMPEKKS